MSLFPGAIQSERARRGAAFLRRMLLVGATAMALSACQDSGSLNSGRAWKPIPRDTLALMHEKGTNKHAPILIRAFKKEAELEVWKMRADGTYTHLKTYPVCRWSGQLGPKRREGDRQVPEGFYSVTPGLMNPNSAYYLSFNIGYPNAYDRAQGFTGSLIMVHGDCSSRGCFAMTDEQMGEIYAIAREAFAGGQRSIQVQSLPFRMTPENLARYRLDPNMKFWREIKEGVDIFEVTRREPQVAVCGRRYVFNAIVPNGAHLDPTAPCPPLGQDPELQQLLAKHRKAEETKVAELINKGVRPVRLQFADGGQHPAFAKVEMVSRPEALATPPIEIALDEPRTPPLVQVASARTQPAVAARAAQPAPTEVARAAPAQNAGPPAASAYAQSEQQAPFYRRWLGMIGVGDAQASAPAAVPAAAVPLPPPAQRGAARPNATAPRADAPRRDGQRTSELPPMIRGAHAPLPAYFMAYAPHQR